MPFPRERPGGSLEVAGPIDADTEWDADTVRVTGDLSLLDGITLSIAAGTRVEFQGHYRLDVQGRLLALGLPQAPITFTSADPAAFAIDSTLSGAWNGLRFMGTPETNGVSRLEHCIIEYAKAARDTALFGPVMLEGFSRLSVVNSIIRHNVADYGAAICCMHSSAPRLIGCLFTDNYAFKAGSVLWCVDSFPRLVNCTLAENSDLNLQIFDPAAPVTSFLSKPQTSSSILWGNATNYFIPAQLYEAKAFYTRDCDVEWGYPGENNIDLDPLFAGDGEHPFRLLADSPCVNAGAADTTGYDLPMLDLAGWERVREGRVDQGAYEFHPGTPVEAPLPAELCYMDNFPNPFNPRTTIRVSPGVSGRVELAIFDVRGRRIATLLDADLDAGIHSVTWQAQDERGRPLPSGLYTARLQSPIGSASLKLILLT